MATEGQHQAQLKIDARVDTAEKSLKKLQGEFTKLTGKVEKQAKAQKKASKGLDKFEQRMGKMSGSLSRLSTGFGLAGLAGSIGLAVTAIDQVMDRSLRYQNVMNNMPFSIDKATQSTMGLVDSFTLAQQAVVANRFGVVKTAEEYARLTEVAAKLAITQGKDVVASIEDITKGIARGSPMILDNLGLTIKLSEANRKFAEANNMAVSAMTAEQKIQALLNNVLEKGEAATKNAKIETEGLAFAWGQAKIKIKNATDYLSTEGIKDLQKYIDALREASFVIDTFSIFAGEMEVRIARLRAEVARVQGPQGAAEREDPAKAAARAERAHRQRQLDARRDEAEARAAARATRGRGAKAPGRVGEDPLEKVLDDIAEDVKARREGEEALQSIYDEADQREADRDARAQERRDRNAEHFAKSLAKQQALQEKHLQFTMRITDQVSGAFGAAAFSAIDSTETFGRAIAIEAGLAARSAARVLWVDSLKWTARGVAASIALSPRAPLFFAAAGKAAAGAAALGALGLGLGAATGTGLFAPGARLGGTTGGGGTLGTPSRGFGEGFTPQSQQLPSSATMKNTRSLPAGGGGDVYNIEVKTLEASEEIGVKFAQSVRMAKQNGLSTELA